MKRGSREEALFDGQHSQVQPPVFSGGLIKGKVKKQKQRSEKKIKHSSPTFQHRSQTTVGKRGEDRGVEGRRGGGDMRRERCIGGEES